MLKKIMALATTTAMLGSHVAAYAMNTARAVVKTVTGSPTGTEQNSAPVDGRKILPSIPPSPPEAVSNSSRARSTQAARKPAGHKGNRTRPRGSKAGKKAAKR